MPESAWAVSNDACAHEKTVNCLMSHPRILPSNNDGVSRIRRATSRLVVDASVGEKFNVEDYVNDIEGEVHLPVANTGTFSHLTRTDSQNASVCRISDGGPTCRAVYNAVFKHGNTLSVVAKSFEINFDEMLEALSFAANWIDQTPPPVRRTRSRTLSVI